MTAWGVRTRGYQAGVILLYVSTCLFLIGILSPKWLTYHRDVILIRTEHWFAGIVVGCKYHLSRIGHTSFDYTRCGFGFTYAFERMPGMGQWVHAVEVFEILSALALIFACIYAALFNCFTQFTRPRNRILEITSGVAGLVGFSFTMVFVGKLRSEVEKDTFYYFYWAFYLTVVSSISVVVAAVIIALYNEYIPPPADYNYSNASLARKPPSVISYSSNRQQLYNPRSSREELYHPRISHNDSRISHNESRISREEELYDPRIMEADEYERERTPKAPMQRRHESVL